MGWRDECLALVVAAVRPGRNRRLRGAGWVPDQDAGAG